MCGSAADCHLQLHERHVLCSVAMQALPRSEFLVVVSSSQRHVAALCMLYKVNSNSNHCLLIELPSASTVVPNTRAALAAHP